ncbi:conjugal transfer protein TraH [Massilia sp. WF1]|uniref:conjugal transfer protein TraH n=1 Tax=unclassified Massilia TaxID=2609279 RepID=UPI0006497802|nr:MULTISPECIES: conjugal transfer protein TraH [unclassified Massilia]ALK99941.1 conjugal transfer protein TraH [Massilia sp. WG5]KLU36816.1 conjugal transfer protein TraH [Massilia sp. WF1]
MKKRTILAVFLFCLLSTSARAGIMADLNSMFMSNSTDPGTFTTRDRVGIYAGGYSMRTPIHNINVVAFDPPRLNAGCGGVDLYGGSFSFINGQELIAIFRSVASNAAGLAFKAAIKVISPSLDSLMTEFQTMLQNMNNLAKNSCSLAHLLVDKADRALADATDGDGAVGSSMKGIFSDLTAGLKDFNTNASQYLKKAGEVNPRVGNQVAKAIVSSGTSSVLGVIGLANIDGSADDSSNPNSLNNRVLMSMLGYEIAGIPCRSFNPDGVEDTTSNQSTNNVPRVSCKSGATITLEDFVTGGGTGSSRPDYPLHLYTCLDPNGTTPSSGGFDPQICTQIKVEDFNYQGIEGWINGMLFGSPDDTSIDPASIVGIINSGTSGQFSTAQLQFLHQANYPIIALLQKTSNPEARKSMARRMRVGIRNCVAAQLGGALYRAASSIGNNNSYVLTDEAKQNIERLRNDFMERQQSCDHDRSVLEIAQLLNQAAILNSVTNR